MEQQGNRERILSLYSVLRIEGFKGACDWCDYLCMFLINVLKKNPVARIGVVFYLTCLHWWVGGILVYWAHNFEKVHGDFGSYRHREQVGGY